MGRAYRHELRQLAMKMVKGGAARDKVARQLQISVATVNVWASRLRTRGHLRADKVGGSKKPLMCSAAEKQLLRLLAGRCSSCREISAMLKMKGIEISCQTLAKRLNEMGLRYKAACGWQRPSKRLRYSLTRKKLPR